MSYPPDPAIRSAHLVPILLISSTFDDEDDDDVDGEMDVKLSSARNGKTWQLIVIRVIASDLQIKKKAQ